MADITKVEVVDRIAQLGREAASFEIKSFSPPAGVSGLPSSVSFGFDHRTGQVRDLKDTVERWRLHPERRTGTAAVQTLSSFIDLVNRHKSKHSAIFASTSWPNPSLTAVIDYHDVVNATDGVGGEAPKARFCHHRILYPFPLTDEFKAWAGQDSKGMTQGEFAAFIEERVAELTQPLDTERSEFEPLFSTKIATPSDMLALSRGLEVNVAGRVKQTTRLSSGEGELVFVEEHLDGKGDKIVVPGLFMVSVPAFLDGAAVRLPARLRYRVASGAVSWFYQLFRWKELLRERVVADLDRATDETALPAYEGAPEA